MRTSWAAVLGLSWLLAAALPAGADLADGDLGGDLSAAPRFEPISEEAWNAALSTGMPDVTPAFPLDGGN